VITGSVGANRTSRASVWWPKACCARSAGVITSARMRSERLVIEGGMPVSGSDVLRVESSPREGPHMELLTFTFPDVDGMTGELVMHWGTTVVPLRIQPLA
jgi:hypothetical protein